jgi:hypothetical protein
LKTDQNFRRALLHAGLAVTFWPAAAVLLFAAADWLRYGGL